MATWLAFELQDEPGKAAAPIVEDAFINRGDELAERMQFIYARRAEQFLTDIDAEYRSLGGFRRPGEFPSVTLTLPLGTVTVQFDAELDSQLLFLYVLHGWSGMRELEQAVVDRRVYPGTGIREPWESTLKFFRITRHLLALRIRSALISVESSLRKVIFERLEVSRKSLDEVIAALKIDSGAEGGSGKAAESSESAPLRAHNEAMLADAYARVSAVFNKRRVLARLRRDLQELDSRLSSRKQALRDRTEDLSGGVVVPSERADLPESKDVASAQEERDRASAEAADTEQGLKELSDALGTLLPPLLLAVPQLKDEFTRPDFDKAVVETIVAMRRLIDDLVPATAPSSTSVASHVPFDVASLNRLDEVALTPLDVAAIVAKGALDLISDDVAQTALVDDQTLREALTGGVFPVGGFEYVVATHYTVALIDATEALRQKEAAWKSVADACAKLGAGASLAAGVAPLTGTPLGLAAAPPLRIAAFAFSLPPLIFAAYSVVHQLSKIDQAIRLRVTSADFDDIASVVQLGDLVELRARQVEELSDTVMRLLFEQLANDVAVLKKLLLLRGYLYDIESLLPSETAEGTEGTDG